MTTDNESAKLCDSRLIVIDQQSLNQSIVEYEGHRVVGRKFPTLSCPENIVENHVLYQKLFIMGGYNTMYKLVNDRGYFMYDAAQNEMSKVTLDKPDNVLL